MAGIQYSLLLRSAHGRIPRWYYIWRAARRYHRPEMGSCTGDQTSPGQTEKCNQDTNRLDTSSMLRLRISNYVWRPSNRLAVGRLGDVHNRLWTASKLPKPEHLL
jgi:hypothetical protein